jgi:integrase
VRTCALSDAQVRTVTNVLDRLEDLPPAQGPPPPTPPTSPATHRHARPYRDRAIVHVLFATGLRRGELVGLDLAQLQPHDPAELRRVKKARLVGVRGKRRTRRTVFLGRDAGTALADYLDHERTTDTDEQSTALFLAANSNRHPTSGRAVVHPNGEHHYRQDRAHQRPGNRRLKPQTRRAAPTRCPALGGRRGYAPCRRVCAGGDRAGSVFVRIILAVGVTGPASRASRSGTARAGSRRC